MKEMEIDHPMYKKISEREKIRVYQDKESPFHYMCEVSQSCKLGKLGLDSFLEKGINGPKYDLSNLPIIFHYNPKFDVININLFDMDINLEKNDKNYKIIKNYLDRLL